MKKIISIITIALVLSLTIFSQKIYADTLDNISVSTDKTTVNPNETITLTISFGVALGSYTFDIAYDSNLVEFVSTNIGETSDNGTRVRVLFYDSTGGSNPSSSLTVTFKAKDGITTTNPTNFSITAEGLANADASTVYDDITTPITKDFVVEPVYIDYSIALNYTGNVYENVKKDMQIVVSSDMGKSYEHTRIIAEVNTTSGGTVQLLATDTELVEYDIIQSGWGDTAGDSIGGSSVSKQLSTTALFSAVGSYSITLSLIDLDNNNAVIATNTFNIVVEDETQNNESQDEENNNGIVDDETTDEIDDETDEDTTEELGISEENTDEPTNLPKTGNTVYVWVLVGLGILVSVYFVMRKK